MERDIAWLLNEKYQGRKTAGFYADCEKIEQGEPLAYVIGHIPFCHTTIQLDSRPLIPRVETEYWTAHLIKKIRADGDDQEYRILDLCAGSGCIGVAMAHALPHTHLTFLEINDEHIDTIASNCKQNNLAKHRYDIYAGDLFQPLSATTFDYIVTNPPYIDPTIDRTTEAVRAFEPHEALYGGPHGLLVIERILAHAAEYLTAQGELWMEHEPEQVDALKKLTPATLRLQRTHNDQYGQPRVSVWTVAL